WTPTSARAPSSSTVRSKPPGSERRSYSVTRTPASARAHAAARPAGPLPTTPTSRYTSLSPPTPARTHPPLSASAAIRSCGTASPCAPHARRRSTRPRADTHTRRTTAPSAHRPRSPSPSRGSTPAPYADRAPVAQRAPATQPPRLPQPHPSRSEESGHRRAPPASIHPTTPPPHPTRRCEPPPACTDGIGPAHVCRRAGPCRTGRPRPDPRSPEPRPAPRANGPPNPAPGARAPQHNPTPPVHHTPRPTATGVLAGVRASAPHMTRLSGSRTGKRRFHARRRQPEKKARESKPAGLSNPRSSRYTADAAVVFHRPNGNVGTGRTLPPQMNAEITGGRT